MLLLVMLVMLLPCDLFYCCCFLGQDITFDEVTATIHISDENNNPPVFTQTYFIGGEDAVEELTVQKSVFYVIYQRRKTKITTEYDAQHSIFHKFRGVLKCGQALS